MQVVYRIKIKQTRGISPSTKKGIWKMTKKNTLTTPEGKSFTFVIPDDAKADSRGFYQTNYKAFRKANPHIDFDYLAHDLKHRGLNADNDFYERNGVQPPKVAFSASLVREPLKPKSDDWQETAHQWVITINGQTFDYYTGLAHRAPKKFSSCVEEYNRLKHKNLTAQGLASLLSASVPKSPSIEDVLHALINDGEASTMSFNDWCDMFGYDNDSLSARKTYDACQENGDKLSRAGVHINDDLRKYFEDF